ncbi:MAG: sialate O-acetylesterase, partial [Verrucomicrobiales bacterium]
MRVFILLILVLNLQAAHYDLVVLAGQSNAQGWAGDARHYPRGQRDLDAQIPFYYHFPRMSSSEGKWISLSPQKGRFKAGHFGPEITFARELLQQGRQPAIFKFTVGGSSLEKMWKPPGNDGLYDVMIRSLRHATATLEDKGHQVTISALIWIQGEADAVEPGSAARYETHLRQLIAHFRTHVAERQQLPILLGLDEQNPYVRRRPIVLSAQKKIAIEDAWIERTSMLKLRKSDRTHLTPSALE